MGQDDDERSRRRFLHATGAASLIGLSGCIGEDQNFGNVQLQGMETVPDADPGDGYEAEPIDEPVPEVEASCTSIDGVERDPDDLDTKADAAYQEFPSGYQLCANCTYFCPSETSENTGACTEVEGRIGSQHWCALWVPAEFHEGEPVSEEHADQQIEGN